MVDTVKFQVRVDETTYKAIKGLSIAHIQKDYVKKQQEMRYMQTDVYIPSYDYHITLKAFDETERRISFECSLPKLYFGENIGLLYCDQIVPALKQLWASLTAIFPDFPSYGLWFIERLDLCYAWRFPTQERAQILLNHLKLLTYPRKNKYIYQTALMFRGRHYTPKFYLKKPEFMRHDYTRLVKAGKEEFANKLAGMSNGVLRFEITARKEQLKHWFEKDHIYYADILNQPFLETLMNDCLNKILQNRSPESMNDETIIRKLEYKWGKAKGARLFAFYNTYYSDALHKKEIMESGYSYSTIWRKRKDITSAGVGLGNETLNFGFDLSIPSVYVVKKDPVPMV